MVLNLDLAPTFLSLAGVRVPSSVQGRSWLEVAGGRTPADWRRDFVYEYAWEQDFPYTPNIIGLRNETHSLMSYPGTWDIPELYDIRADPEQSANLLAGARIGPRMRGRYAHHIADPQVRKTVESMQSRLAASLAQTGGDPRLAGKIGENDRFAF
jgi:arylsulfatase A-like enzyme